MLSTVQSSAGCRSTEQSARPSKAVLIERVRTLLPGVPEECHRFQSGLLFLASQWTPNVDRLARFTGQEREFVARRARRWMDHGLWNTDHSDGDALDPTHLAHAVEVGEGLVRPPVAESETDDHRAFAGPAETEADFGFIPQHAPHAAPRLEDPMHSAPSASDRARDGKSEADALLAMLWSRMGLASGTVSPERRAA